jgi:hypothetical protein
MGERKDSGRQDGALFWRVRFIDFLVGHAGADLRASATFLRPLDLIIRCAAGLADM